MGIRFETLIDDERGCVRLELNSEHGMFLHLTLKKWNPDVLRALKDGIAVLKGTLRLYGIRHLQVVIPEGDEKMYRFEKLFGFEEARRAGGLILMRQEC